MQVKIILFILISGLSLRGFSKTGEFRIIYIIHGDANYLFHDEERNALDASERILSQAQFVAENIKRGEVYIFYQKPVKKFIFFTNDDGEFYYYKNGVNLGEETYSRDEEESYEAESGLIRSYSDEFNSDKINIILYYGHHIPVEDSSGYNLSYPNNKFGLNIFADGISRIKNSFLPPDGKIDLLVLSTCRNGDEKTLSKLSFITKYLIASPGDIHLSHLNSESLINIYNQNYHDTREIAKEFASFAFNKLSYSTSTEISINLYELNEVSGIKSKCISKMYRAPKFGRKINNMSN